MIYAIFLATIFYNNRIDGFEPIIDLFENKHSSYLFNDEDEDCLIIIQETLLFGLRKKVYVITIYNKFWQEDFATFYTHFGPKYRIECSTKTELYKHLVLLRYYGYRVKWSNEAWLLYWTQ